MNKIGQNIRWFLPPEGVWCKANLHCHTTLSHGAWTPERVKEEYQKRDYSVVTYTDHNTYHFHKSLCDESFVALAALEVNIDKPMQQSGMWNTTPVYHLNFYDTKPESRALPVPLPKRFDDSPHAVNLYIEQMKKLGFFCCYNHPWWSLQTSEVYRQLRSLDAFEFTTLAAKRRVCTDMHRRPMPRCCAVAARFPASPQTTTTMRLLSKTRCATLSAGLPC